MKWLLSLIAIPLMALTGYGQTQVVVTGNVSGATSGTVTFSLSPWSNGVQYYVNNVTVIGGQTQTCSINSSGVVVGTNGGSCLVWGNDVIAPANTTYTVTFAPNGRVANTVALENITGASYNLNTPVFAPKVSLIPQYNSIISNPAALGVNVIPTAPHAFTVGAPGDPYANGYFDNITGLNSLNVNQLNVNSITGLSSLSLNTLNAMTLNKIELCDQFPGSSAGAQIQACIAALPSTGGMADACSITGSQTISADPFVGVTKPVLLRLCAATYAITANVTVPPNVEIQASSGTLLSTNTGITLAINGPIDAPSTTILGGSGTVAISNNQSLDAAWFSGADESVKLNGAEVALPSTGGTINASALSGTQALGTTVSLTKPTNLILAYGSHTSSASPSVNIASTAANSSISCGGRPGQQSNGGVSSCILGTTNATGDIIRTAAVATSVHDLTLSYLGTATRTGGAAVNCKANGSVQLDSLRIVATWIGISMVEGACSGAVNRILMTSLNQGSGGAWYTMIALGGCTANGTPAALGCGQAMAFTVTDLSFYDIILSVGATMQSGAAFLLDGGTDSIGLNKIEIIKTGTCATTDCGIMWEIQNTVGNIGFDPPRWITCYACEFEGTATGATSPVIKIAAGKGIKFIGNIDIAGGTQGILLTAGTAAGQYVNDIEIADTSFTQPGQECIRTGDVNGGQTVGPNGIAIGPLQIHDNQFTACSQLANGGYDAVSIGADVTDFTIDHNVFGWQDFAYTNHSNHYIGIRTGGSDHFFIEHNNFNATYTVAGTPINDLSTGSVKNIGPNVFGNGQTDMRIYGQYITTKGYGPTTLPSDTAMGIGCGGSSDPSAACSIAFSDGTGRYLAFGGATGSTFSPTFKIWDTGVIGLFTSTFANLSLHATTANGSVMYCSDCLGPTDGSYTAGNAAAGSGSGALVVRVNGTWRTY